MELFWIHFTHHSWLFQLSFVLYLLAGLGFLLSLLLDYMRPSFRLFHFLSGKVFFLAFAFLLSWFILRWIEVDRPPIRTLYESLVLWCLTVSLLFLLLHFLYNLRSVGAFVSLACLVILSYAILHRDVDSEKLPPALLSPWFIPHVTCYFVAYGGYLLATLFALLYLFFPQWKIRKEAGWASPYAKQVQWSLEEMAYETVKFSFIAGTLALGLGCIWAKFAWSTWWGWDPKENWALATWFAYLACLHLRYLPRFKGKPFAISLLLAFFVVLFTYLGMSLLPTVNESLHVFDSSG